MLIFGLLSIIQQTFLPGYLFLILIRIKNLTPIQLITYTTALSLFLNYQIILLLNYFDLYSRLFVFILILLEISIILIKRKNLVIPQYPFSEIYSRLKTIIKGWPLILILLVIMFYLSLFLVNTGSVFYYLDASIGNHFFSDHMGFWYKYSLFWAQDLFPPQSYYFPQLWPANWSISHVLIDDLSVTIFNKIIMSAFPLLILFLFLDLALLKQRKVFLVGLLLFALMVPTFYSVLFLVDGNPELSVMFFSFLALYYFYLNQHQIFKWENLILLTIFTSSAALTKLSGFSLVILLFGWLVLSTIFQRNYSIIFKLKRLVAFIAILSFNLIWYLIKPMHSGLNQSGYFAGETYLGRFLMGVDLIASNFGLPFFIFLMFFFLLSMINKESRYLSFFVVLPILGIYTALYAYSIRNASISIPFLAFVVPFGIEQVLKKFQFNFSNVNIKIVYTFIISALVIIVFSIPSIYNLIDSLNLFIRSKYFNFTSEKLDVFLGYTKYYEVIINAVRITGLLVILMLFIRRIKVSRKIWFAAVTIILFILNFTMLDKEELIKIQKGKIKEIAVQNFDHLIRTKKANPTSLMANTDLENSRIKDITFNKEIRLSEKYLYDYIFFEKEKNIDYEFDGYTRVYDDLSYAVYEKN